MCQQQPKVGIKEYKKNMTIRGSYNIEYAVLLCFAVVFLYLADLTPIIGEFADKKMQRPNLNSEAYYTVSEHIHANQIQKIPVINYSDNLMVDYSITQESSSFLWSIIKGLLKVFGVEFNDTYYLHTLKLNQNTNYVVDIMEPNKTVNVNGTKYSLADFKFTYVVYTDKENVANNSGTIQEVAWPVDIATNDKANQQLLFTFSYTTSKWNDEVSLALNKLLQDNLLVKEKNVTYISR